MDKATRNALKELGVEISEGQVSMVKSGDIPVVDDTDEEAAFALAQDMRRRSDGIFDVLAKAIIRAQARARSVGAKAKPKANAKRKARAGFGKGRVT